MTESLYAVPCLDAAGKFTGKVKNCGATMPSLKMQGTPCLPYAFCPYCIDNKAPQSYVVEVADFVLCEGYSLTWGAINGIHSASILGACWYTSEKIAIAKLWEWPEFEIFISLQLGQAYEIRAASGPSGGAIFSGVPIPDVPYDCLLPLTLANKYTKCEYKETVGFGGTMTIKPKG